MKINWKKITGIYLMIFCIILLVYNSVYMPLPEGEWDDYSLPIASIMNGNGLGISASDIETYKKIFPEWAECIDGYGLSPFMTKDGAQMPWYFPEYAIACIPFTLLLQAMELPTIYAFPYTNITLLIVSFIMVWKCLYISEKRKVLFIALLSVNPIIFYIGWPSAEVLIYSALIAAFVSWYNRWYRRAAVFVSIAGILNPTIMSIGFFMIAEYFIVLIKNRNKEISWKNFFKNEWRGVVAYGCCYIVGLVPMAYNYYHTGHINLTASAEWLVPENEKTLDRFASYLFDLNYGILPYFCILLIIAIILCVPAALHKQWRYLEWTIVFALNVYLYSIFHHINSGMDGIARYNAWGIVPLLFAVCLFFDQILGSRRVISCTKAALMLGICLTGVIVFVYNPYKASNTSRLAFTPIAKGVLDNIPCLYNPLPSTFRSRTCHVDGGYWGNLPLIYFDEDMCARKILLDSSDADILRYELSGNAEDMAWLDTEINKVTGMRYISVSRDHSLKAASIECQETIWLSGEQYNAEEYMITGISYNEGTHTWGDGNRVDFRFKSTDFLANEEYWIHIVVGGLINDRQQVILLCNGEEIYNECLVGASEIIVPFSISTTDDLANFSILLPDAVTGTGGDPRNLSISLESIALEKKQEGD